ncbi:hypothetical protein L3Q82_010121, partial [Scortum barcoo]
SQSNVSSRVLTDVSSVRSGLQVAPATDRMDQSGRGRQPPPISIRGTTSAGAGREGGRRPASSSSVRSPGSELLSSAARMSHRSSPVRAYDFLLKFLLVGDSDVGKGEILASLQDGATESPYGYNMGIDCKTTTILLDGRRVKLQLCLVSHIVIEVERPLVDLGWAEPGLHVSCSTGAPVRASGKRRSAAAAWSGVDGGVTRLRRLACQREPSARRKVAVSRDELGSVIGGDGVGHTSASKQGGEEISDHPGGDGTGGQHLGPLGVEIVGHQEEALVLRDAVEFVADVHLDLGRLPLSLPDDVIAELQKLLDAGITNAVEHQQKSGAVAHGEGAGAYHANLGVAVAVQLLCACHDQLSGTVDLQPGGCSVKQQWQARAVQLYHAPLKWFGAGTHSPPMTDTSGQGRFCTIFRSYSRGAQGVILVYDITNRWSFDGIDRWIKEINEHAPGVPKILVGNRLHLAYKRQVTTEQAQVYAEKLGVTFFEVSPLCNFNITEVVHGARSHRADEARHGASVETQQSFFCPTVLSLQDLCCRSIVSCTPVHLVDKLPLPLALKSHLKSFSMANGLNARMMHGRSYSVTANATTAHHGATKRTGGALLKKPKLIRPPPLSPSAQSCRNSCKIS